MNKRDKSFSLHNFLFFLDFSRLRRPCMFNLSVLHQLQDFCVSLSGHGLYPESEEPMSISSLIGSKSYITVPFANPTEHPVWLDITLTGHRHFRFFSSRHSVVSWDTLRHVPNIVCTLSVFMSQMRIQVRPPTATKALQTWTSSLSL